LQLLSYQNLPLQLQQETRKMTLDQQYLALLNDLRGKLHRYDWHGVSDAANDLRVLEEQIKIHHEIAGAPWVRPGSV
jgi:hypothetical protein